MGFVLFFPSMHTQLLIPGIFKSRLLDFFFYLGLLIVTFRMETKIKCVMHTCIFPHNVPQRWNPSKKLVTSGRSVNMQFFFWNICLLQKQGAKSHKNTLKHFGKAKKNNNKHCGKAKKKKNKHQNTHNTICTMHRGVTTGSMYWNASQPVCHRAPRKVVHRLPRRFHYIEHAATWRKRSVVFRRHAGCSWNLAKTLFCRPRQPRSTRESHKRHHTNCSGQ